MSHPNKSDSNKENIPPPKESSDQSGQNGKSGQNGQV